MLANDDVSTMDIRKDVDGSYRSNRYLLKLKERGIPVTISEDGKRAEIRSLATGRVLLTVGLDT